MTTPHPLTVITHADIENAILAFAYPGIRLLLPEDIEALTILADQDPTTTIAEMLAPRHALELIRLRAAIEAAMCKDCGAPATENCCGRLYCFLCWLGHDEGHY